VGRGGLAPAIPLAVLVNKQTASAAEIVAGALQDARRATLLGEKTFGTGTVLQSFPLSDGSALLLGVGEWLTPAGHLIWHQGITPDVPAVLVAKAEPLAPATERGMSRAQLASSGDVPLLRALDLLEPAPTLANVAKAHRSIGETGHPR
jgi:carboxyl-terminal processing protease